MSDIDIPFDERYPRLPQVRVSREVKDTVTQIIQESGLSYGGYIRHLIGAHGTRARRRSRPVQAELVAIMRQVSGIGTNLNQLAKQANTNQGSLSAAERATLARALEEYQVIRDALEQLAWGEID